MFKKIKKLFSKEEIKKLLGITVFSIIISLSEVVGLSTIVPFMAMVTNQNIIFENRYLKLIYNFFNFESTKNFIFYFGITIVIIFLIKNILNIFFNYVLVSFTRNNYYKFTNRLMNNYLKYPYQNFVKKNSNDLMKNITTETNMLVNLIQSLLMLISEICIAFFIYLVMLYVDLKITLFVTVFMGANILLIKYLILNKTKKWGVERSKAIEEYYQIIGSTFGNYKFIKLQSNDEKIMNNFQNSCNKYIKVDKKYMSSQPVPRLILEFLGFSIVVVLIIFSVMIYDENGLAKIMPIISIFFIGLYRILPSVNRIINNYQTILFYRKSLDTVVDELESEIENIENNSIEFNKKIELKDICFEFEKGKEVLKNINLNIFKGEKVAFVGESGSGKTTLVDLITGLYKPKNGNVYLDDIKLEDKNIGYWRQSIGYIPQEVYLFDGTIADNVVFNREYNEERLIESLKKARIWEFLKKKEGIKTIVGDRGIILSGGQKQRIAIARALYDNPEVLVLDEATSALDNETEEEIMKEIYNVSKDRTLIIVAHRLTTLKDCDRIFVINNGEVERMVKSVDEL
ncbi:ABC transporter ATP-binding protein [Fusobacterium varium]|uniref:ABC transporter ATP-binding protein n=1 Tax=Fusobacterium varium ATCC 27725 TaxID=469618 RepID=A0ABN5JGE6_FUSVA|nr:ABC transporter ATP-binding protein [Fusobacterium varium]AVQ29823.1 ABC transporter ATP-binding protein [Fusobacterium varium ATCC 27725]EES65113.1 ABC transporter, ATP-binding protein [Fusobacterium varium ATCC 27725]